MNSKEQIPLFYLRFLRSIQDGRRYSVHEKDDSKGNPLPQNLDYFPFENQIDFLEPYSNQYPTLKENESRLKKILATSMRIDDPEKINIPFSFNTISRRLDYPQNAIRIYTDGSLSPAGTGGWAGIKILPGERIIENSGIEKDSSSNRMELFAVVKLLESIDDGDCAIVHTDSRYVIKGVEEWLANWEMNGYMTAMNRPAKNSDVWRRLSSLIKTRDIYFKWIQSRSGNPYHDRCDQLARTMSNMIKK